MTVLTLEVGFHHFFKEPNMFHRVRWAVHQASGEHHEQDTAQTTRGGEPTDAERTSTLASTSPPPPEDLPAYRIEQQFDLEEAGHDDEEIVFVFSTGNSTQRDAADIRRDLRKVIEDAEVEEEWTPREFRRTFVSLMSDQGASDELIADLDGHKRTSTTRVVYRKQLRPVITKGQNCWIKPSMRAYWEPRSAPFLAAKQNARVMSPGRFCWWSLRQFT